MPRLKLTGKQSQSQRDKNSNETMLMFRYTHQSKTTYFFTGKNIDIQFLDLKNQCIKKSFNGHIKLNLLISTQGQKINDIINTAMTNEINPTTEYVKGIYDNLKAEKEARIKISFWVFVEEYMKEAKLKLHPNTLRCYNNIINNLKAFEKYENTKLDWHSFDVKFYYKFLDFYTGYKKLGNNGFGKIIKVLKSILNCATDRGVNTILLYKSKEFKALREDVGNIYLTEEELNKIINLDLSESKKLDQARDLFIVGCYTGLRFSDFSKLSSSNISDGLIRIKTQKTSTNVVIPLLPEVERIIVKYNGNLPKAYCNQKMNEYLKLIGNKAEMFEKIQKNRLSGVKEIKNTLEKWQLICTHTARRSFATNMYKRGLDSIAIMQLTGHSTEKSFMTYIKISQEENARKILDYFKMKQESLLASA